MLHALLKETKGYTSSRNVLNLTFFEKDAAIIKDKKNIYYICDVLFNENKPFFINIKEKELQEITIKDIQLF
jgi:hypothetical protein